MPDSWESAHGLDALIPDQNRTQLSMPMLGVPGYTNLEVYLHKLSEQRTHDRRWALLPPGFASEPDAIP